MTDWHDLVVAATVGTASRPVDLAATPEPVFAAAPPGTDPAGSLLDAAVAFTVAQRAGRRAGRGVIPEPSPADPRPVVSPLAASLLAPVLVDRETDLARVALAEVAAAGRRLPDALVPAALAVASRHVALRPPVLAACGPVAGWLGRRNPEWAWAAAVGPAAPQPFDPAAWETGSRAERLAQLRTLRSTDPAAAGGLLHMAWPSTAPDERADLLAVLGPVPLPADEVLLEATLDERRQAVRDVAAALLARLEGSAFRARAAQRVHGLLRVERRGLRRRLVLARLPVEFDAAAIRDGLPRTVSPVAARVRALVGAAPLDVWERETGLHAEQLLALPGDEAADDVLTGWVTAVGREHDRRWAAALLDRAADRAPVQATTAALLALLTPPDRDRRVLDAVARGGPELAVLAVATRPWNPALTAAVGRWVQGAVRRPPGRALVAVFGLCGVALPATAEHAEALRRHAETAPAGAVWLPAARAGAHTLDLRRRLREELQ